VIEVVCGASIAAACIVALTVRRQTIGIGFQTLQVTHAFALFLAIPALTVVVQRVGRSLAPRVRTATAAAALLALALVGNRAARAVLHDQPHRAYALSEEERRAYAWIAMATPRDAVVAAHPDHQVNPGGETLQRTNVLTAWTNRRVYVQRAGVDQRALVEERSDHLRQLFAATHGAHLCAAAAAAHLDYLIEYPDARLTVSAAPCLAPAFDAGAVRVWRVSEP
jgi:hypothetical protein